MHMMTRRSRGRPLGSSVHAEGDRRALAQMADMLVRDPRLKPTTAIKRLMLKHEGPETEATLLRRWQRKWKISADHLMAAAEARLAAEQQRGREHAASRGVSLLSPISRVGAALEVIDKLQISPTLLATISKAVAEAEKRMATLASNADPYISAALAAVDNLRISPTQLATISEAAAKAEKRLVVMAAHIDANFAAMNSLQMSPTLLATMSEAAAHAEKFKASMAAHIEAALHTIDTLRIPPATLAAISGRRF